MCGLLTNFVHGEIVPVGTCVGKVVGSPDFPADWLTVAPLSASVSTVEEICLVKLDLSVSYFDNQLEWFQSTLLEAKCRLSDWLIIVLHGQYLKSVHSQIVDIVENYSHPDLLIVDEKVPEIYSVYQLVNGVLDIDDTQLRIYTACTSDLRPPFTSLTSKSTTRIDFRTRKTFSKTSDINLYATFTLALLAGIATNVAARKWINRQKHAYAIPV